MRDSKAQGVRMAGLVRAHLSRTLYLVNIVQPAYWRKRANFDRCCGMTNEVTRGCCINLSSEIASPCPLQASTMLKHRYRLFGTLSFSSTFYSFTIRDESTPVGGPPSRGYSSKCPSRGASTRSSQNLCLKIVHLKH